MLHYKVASTHIEIERSLPIGPTKSIFGNAFNTPVHPAIMNRALAINMMMAEHAFVDLPNKRFISAIGVSSIQEDIRSIDPKYCSETEDILSDPVIMEALQCADRQYREGKAIPLKDLMRELGLEEDEL